MKIDMKDTLIEKISEFLEKEKPLKLTMDDIASALKMSKKTIYKYFASKDELVKAVVWVRAQILKKNIEKIADQDVNVIQKFLNLTDFLLTRGLKFLQVFLEPMAEMDPKWWEKLEEFRAKLLTENISKIVNQGKAEGLVIDRDTEIIKDIYISAIRGLVNPVFLKKSNMPVQHVVTVMLEILFRGMLTEKGLKIYNKLNKENGNEN